VKRKEWIPFVSLGVFLAVMNLTIAAFGFERIDRLEGRMDRIEARIDRIEARMDRLEERLSSLEQRVSRIEGVLLLRVERAEAGAPPGDRPEVPKG
jgi:predicted nuclease with TOPRIM domain